MCQQTDEPRRFEIIDGPGELDVVVSMLRGEEITLGIVIDDHADELGRLPDCEECEFVVDGLWKVHGKPGLYSFSARSKRTSYELFCGHVYGHVTRGGGVVLPEIVRTRFDHITGEYSLRTRKGWLTLCAAEAKVVVSHDEAVATT